MSVNTWLYLPKQVSRFRVLLPSLLTIPGFLRVPPLTVYAPFGPARSLCMGVLTFLIPTKLAGLLHCGRSKFRQPESARFYSYPFPSLFSSVFDKLPPHKPPCPLPLFFPSGRVLPLPTLPIAYATLSCSSNFFTPTFFPGARGFKQPRVSPCSPTRCSQSRDSFHPHITVLETSDKGSKTREWRG